MPFAHLHVHSEYSLLDGACRIADLPQRAREMGQTALAISDHGNMYGAVAFYKACVKEGIQPIIGCEVYMAPKSRFDKEQREAPYHLVLLCKDEAGYKNLCYMVSLSYIEGFYSRPRIDWELLKEHSQGLICLSGCLSGEIPKRLLEGEYDAARELALRYKDLFGKDAYYLEIQNHFTEENLPVMEGLIKLSKETGIPLVATNDAHYLKKEDARIHDVLLCVQTGKTVDDQDRMRFEPEEFYLKSEEEMRALFPQCPEAVENTMRVAEQCKLAFDFNAYHLPEFTLPEPWDDAKAYLQQLCAEGFARRYGAEREEVKQQFADEIEMIAGMGFVDYFLIVSDFIAYAKKRGISVGPGRGSAAGSVVSYCLGITDVDPIQYGLFFERFLNPERISLPDIDIDFCVERRGEVIDYVVQKYGKDRVAQIVTFGTMAARGAIRDVARALNFSYAEADVVAKQVPQTLNIKLDEALRVSKPLRELYEGDARIKTLIDTARALEGMPRHASTHAAGVLITKRPLYEYLPLAKNDESVVCQYPMNTLEELGLLKMDFLGLRNLTVIRDAVELIQKREPDFDLDAIDQTDKKTFAMLSAGKTMGVFQMESTGITGVCVGLRPQNIEDITAIIALYRPGPMDSIPRFIASKHDPGKISYKHPLLKDMLAVTYGCIVYQEQVIEIFRRVGGFTLGQADMIRRAISKKKQAEIEKERETFIHGDPERGIAGAGAAGVSPKIAAAIYDDIIAFANYAFNKAHAVAYAVISFQTAYLKCHYPREYMAALLTSLLGHSTNLAAYISAIREMGITLLPPDVNASDAAFTVCGKDIRFSLVAVKNIGRGLITKLVENREERGPFTSLDDFIERLHGHELNRRALENLIKCGAFDSLGANRAQLLAIYEPLLEQIAESHRKNLEGQLDFFGSGHESGPKRSGIPLPNVPEILHKERLRMERETTGLYLSGHPMDEFRSLAKKHGATGIGEILADASQEGGGRQFRDEQAVILAGVISHYKTKTTKNNSLMAYITLEDDTGDMELLAFQRTLDRDGAYIAENHPVMVWGKVSLRDDKDPQLLVDQIRPLTDLGAGLPPSAKIPAQKHPLSQKLYLRLPSRESPAYEKIRLILTMFPGESQIILYLEDAKKRLTARCLIHPALLQELKEMLGPENVVLQ